MNLAEARAFLEARRGIQYGDLGVALDLLLPHVEAKFAQAGDEIARRTQERDDALRAASRDRQIVEDIAAGVQEALDAADPEQPGAWIAVIHAINQLPAVASARPVPLERLGGAPRPTPTRRPV